MSNFYQNAPVVDHMPGFTKHNDKVVASAGRMTDANGDINAYDKKDLLNKISALAEMGQNGQLQASSEEDRAERHNLVKAAFHSKGDQMAIAAEVFADDVWETLNRQGFTETLLARKDIADGTDNRVKKRRKDVTAFQAINDGEGIAQIIEQAYVYPQDYYLQCQVLIEEKELAQAGPELMDEKFQDAMEAILVRQDRILRKLMLATAGSFNAPISFANFTPQVMSSLRTQVSSNGLRAANMVVAFDIWDDMLTDPSFTSFWEPVHKYQLIMEGQLGSVLGMNIITDGFRYETLKVLEPGEVFVTGSPVTLGSRGVRRKVEGTEINQYNLGAPRRGFYLRGIESCHVEDRAVSYGVRA